MRPTRLATLLATLLAVGAVSWGLLRVAESRAMTLPRISWTSPLGIALLALVVLVTAIGLRRRLRGHRLPNPLGTARMAVMGKASAHTGPVVGGFYLGYLVLLLPDADLGDRGERAVVCAVALGAALLLSAAGLFLERVCRIDESGDDPPPAPSG